VRIAARRSLPSGSVLVLASAGSDPANESRAPRHGSRHVIRRSAVLERRVVGGVGRVGALVPVTFMLEVGAALVEIIHMVIVDNGSVATVGPVGVRMVVKNIVRRHRCSSDRSTRDRRDLLDATTGPRRRQGRVPEPKKSVGVRARATMMTT
jgi:hypothetical protein